MRSQWIVVLIIAAGTLCACSRQETGWRDAAGADSIAAYEQYLNDFPAGAHAGEARTKLLELRDQEAWAKASRPRTPEAWQRYLGDWPEGRHAATARRLLAKFVSSGASTIGGNWYVQLGAYSSAAAARGNLLRLGREHAGELDAMELLIWAPNGIAIDVWRVRTRPLAEAAARDLCGRLRERGVDCVPVADRSAGHAPP